MSSIASFHEVKRLRRSGLITLTLTDLLIVVVFVLLLFTFRSTEEGRVEISGIQALLRQVTEERDRLKTELAQARQENELLKKQNRDLQEFVQRLLREKQEDTLPADPGETIDKLAAENRALKDMIDQLNKEIERLKRLLETQQAEREKTKQETEGKEGGTGFPRCPVTDGFLLEIRLLESGNLRITPRWDEAANSDARSVPGVSELADAGEVSLETFHGLASRIFQWSDSREPPCRFHVDTRTETKNLETYRRQMGAVDRYFYPTRK